MFILRILLLPFSFIYGLIIQLRNLLYDIHIFKSRKFPTPVISIGNITAGGTGKTPFTVFLAGQLIARGKKVVVVSRGYGRQSHGFHLVSDGNTNSADPLIHGDEPALISFLQPRSIVAVAESRVEAIENLLQQFNMDVILLDDGFQHRAVQRDVDIVILKDKNQLKNRWPLPSGFLREFRFNLKRADIIIDRDNRVANTEHYPCVYQIDGLFDSNFQRQGELGQWKGKSCVAFAGIADPANFEKSLLKNQITIKEFFAYKDHYSFSQNDLNVLISACLKHNCDSLLCTQKDMIKIRQIAGYQKILQHKKISLLAPGLKITLTNEHSFLKKIESHLD